MPMKKILLGTVALVALCASGPVLAADLAPYTKAPVMAAPVYNWTGFYIGAHAGGAITGGIVDPTSGDTSNGQYLAGVQIGADYQFSPHWVVGIEGQYSWLSSNNTAVNFPGGFTYSNDERALGSVTGRLGYVVGPALLYSKGGYAYSDNRQSLTLGLGGPPTAFGLDGSRRDGFTVGAGIEYMFTQNWSGKFEYQYYDFGNSTFVTPAALAAFGAFNNNEHVLKFGLNYRFGVASPVVAKY